MVEQQHPQRQKLRKLERLREQTADQISRSQGTVKQELKKVMAGIDAEIADLKRQLGES